MSWGSALAQVYASASETVQAVARRAVASARAAAELVADNARDAVVKTVQGGANVAGFAGRAAWETASAAGRGSASLADRALAKTPIVGRAYQAAKKRLSPSQTPRKAVVEPCPKSAAAKKRRLERRNALIEHGRAPGSSPQARAAAERLARNNEAVELARLSEDTYAQYGKPPRNTPPVGWTALSGAELDMAGIDRKLLAKSKAVIYQTPADWPGGQKTVLAFRGTEPSDIADLKTNADQALGLETEQYKAASQLGLAAAIGFGPSTLVTGHSLGGGKAQAAGARVGLRGSMFNAAGLHPNSVHGMLPEAGQFTQFRSPGDPLTLVQNSAALQAGVGAAAALAMPLGAGMSAGNFITGQLGMPSLSPEVAEAAGKAATALPRALGNLVSQGNLLPPALGDIVETPALDDTGKPIAASDLLEQHSVHNLINGIEREKSEDVATLEDAT